MNEEKMTYEQALTYYEEKARLGDIDACREVALLILFGPTDNEFNIEKAVPALTRAADKGEIICASILGKYYCGVISEEGNAERAFKYCKQTADGTVGDRDYAEHHRLTGMFYSYGYGCQEDPEKAKLYLERAALEDDGQAQWELWDLMIRTWTHKCPKEDIDGVVREMEITVQAMHWLACAYLNSDEDAVNHVIENGMLDNPLFKEEIDHIQAHGVTPWR